MFNELGFQLKPSVIAAKVYTDGGHRRQFGILVRVGGVQGGDGRPTPLTSKAGGASRLAFEKPI